jgi:hypothetical protein
MTTWSKIIDQCENAINDEGNATWSVDQLVKWINDAVRDYSQHFPHILTDEITVTNGTQEYDLAANFMGILSVEYPDGESPRQFLTRRPYTNGAGSDFWNLGGYYDILARTDDANAATIIFSGELTTDETAVLEYKAHQALIDDANDVSGTVSVPAEHQHLLVKYVQWQATTQLQFAEQQSPTSNSSLLMAQLAQNARRLSLEYATALQQAIYAADGESRPINWITRESGMERIY